jgi:hypothetical protein
MSSGTLRLGASVARLVETRQPFFGAAHAPFRRRAGRAANLASNRPAAVPFTANNTMRARCRSRSSVLVERALSFVAKK